MKNLLLLKGGGGQEHELQYVIEPLGAAGVKKPGAGPTTEKDHRCQNQRFEQQLRREQTDEGEKRETEQHESARQKNIRAAQNFRCCTDQLQIDNKKIETAVAADRADSAGGRRQHAYQDRRTEID